MPFVVVLRPLKRASASAPAAYTHAIQLPFAALVSGYKEPEYSSASAVVKHAHVQLPVREIPSLRGSLLGVVSVHAYINGRTRSVTWARLLRVR